jgi:hypothetical protein
MKNYGAKLAPIPHKPKHAYFIKQKSTYKNGNNFSAASKTSTHSQYKVEIGPQ